MESEEHVATYFKEVSSRNGDCFIRMMRLEWAWNVRIKDKEEELRIEIWPFKSPTITNVVGWAKKYTDTDTVGSRFITNLDITNFVVQYPVFLFL